MTKINRSIFFKTNNFLPSSKNRQLHKFEKKKKNLPPVNLTLKIHVYVLENLWINGGGGGLERRVRTTANMYREINSCQCKRSYDCTKSRRHRSDTRNVSPPRGKEISLFSVSVGEVS